MLTTDEKSSWDDLVDRLARAQGDPRDPQSESWRSRIAGWLLDGLLRTYGVPGLTDPIGAL